MKLLSRLQLEFSHLNEYKFRRKFRDCVSPIYNCGDEIETTKHFFLALPIPFHEFKDKINREIILRTIYYIFFLTTATPIVFLIPRTLLLFFLLHLLSFISDSTIQPFKSNQPVFLLFV